MKSKYYFLLLLSFLTLIGCTGQEEEIDCIPDQSNQEFLGSNQKYLLTDASRKYFLYKGVKSVFFVDQNDREYEYKVRYIEETRNELLVECGEVNFYRIIYDREKIFVDLTNKDSLSHSLALCQSIEFQANETTYKESNLVDKLRIGNNKIDFTKTLVSDVYLTSNRSGNIDVAFHNQDKIINDYTIYGKSFGDVIKLNDVILAEDYSIIYSKSQGIVAHYNGNNDLLVLSRME